MSNDARIAVLETTISHIHEALERLDKRFDHVDRKFEKMDLHFEKVESKIKDSETSLRQEMHSGFRELNNRVWFIFVWVVTSFVGILGLLARSMHWI